MSQYIDVGSAPWQPNFSIAVEGADITDEVRENLINLQITDCGGAEKRSDQVTLSIVSEKLEVPKKGVKLTVGIGFGQQLVSRGSYVVDSASSGGSSTIPRAVQIVARAFSKSDAFGHSAVQSQKTRSFSNVTLGDLLNKIATEHGLTPRVPDSLAGKMIDHVDQVGESDMNLMTRLAGLYGAVSKITHDYWLLTPRDGTTTVSGNELQKLLITRDMTSEWKYQDNSDHADSTSAGKGTQVYAYHDINDGGKIKNLTVGSGQPVQKFGPSSSLKFARDAAGGGSVASKKKLSAMSVTMPATSAMMGLTAQSLITTSGFGAVEDRDWHINKIDFILGLQGFSVKMELE